MNHVVVLLGYLVPGAILGLIATRLAGGMVNPITVYLGIWSLIQALYGLPVLDFPPLAVGTWVLIFASTAAFVAGGLHAGALVRLQLRPRFHGRQSTSPQREAPQYRAELLVKAQHVALLALTLYLVIESFVLLAALAEVGGVGAVLTGDGLNLRWRQMEVRWEEAARPFSMIDVLLGAAGYLFFLGTIAVFWGSRLLLQGRWVIGLAPLALMATFSVLTLQRTTFLYAAVLFVFAYYYHRSVQTGAGALASRRRGVTLIALVPVLALLVPLVIYLPLVLRIPGITPAEAFLSVVEYYVGPLAALNSWVEGSSALAPSALGWGAYTFWGPASVLLRLGVPIDLPPDWLPFSNIQEQGELTVNVYTYLLYLVLDFGVAGALFFAYLLGAASMVLHHRIRVQGRIHLIPAQSIVMTTILFSFFTPTLLRDLRYFLLLVVSVPLGLWLARKPRPLATRTQPAPPALVEGSA